MREVLDDGTVEHLHIVLGNCAAPSGGYQITLLPVFVLIQYQSKH